MKDAAQQMIENYAGLMEEIKHRTEWLNQTMKGEVHLPRPALQEFCFLQLRIICELIALACITAHGELPDVKKKTFQQEWDATKIIKRLDRLHPDFYPDPITVSDIAPGRKEAKKLTEPYLTKKDLIALYARTAQLLHRGSIAKLLTPISPWPSDFSEVSEWTKKIVKLLNDHFIGHHGGTTSIICTMANSDQKVQVMFAEAIGQDDGISLGTAHPTATTLPGLHPSNPWRE